MHIQKLSKIFFKKNVGAKVENVNTTIKLLI